MSEYQKLKARALELQLKRDAEVKRELAAKKERESAANLELEARRKLLDASSAEARRKELVAANAALTTTSSIPALVVEYNPFAEDERGPSTSSFAGPSKPKSKLAVGGRSGSNGAGSMRGAASSGSSVKKERGASTGGRKKEKERSVTPPLLGRKEKRAREFAQQIKKTTKGDSLFSVRNLVETDDRGAQSPQPKLRDKPVSRQPALPRAGLMQPAQIGRTASKNMIMAPGKKGAAAVNELRKLAPNRADWDRRTIDEIQRDIRAAKGKGTVPTAMVRTKSADGGSLASGSTSNGKRPRSTSPSKPINGSSTTPKSKVKTPLPSSARPSTGLTKRPRRPASPSSSSTSSSSHDRHRRRRHHSAGSIHEEDVSATIQAMFRRPGHAPAPKRWGNGRDDGYSDASSDMEAGMSDVEEEERRAARIARREDEAAEREERERKEAKERLKRERLKGR